MYINVHLGFDTKLPGWRHMIAIERGRRWTTLFYPVTGERVKIENGRFDALPKLPVKLRKGFVLGQLRRIAPRLEETKVGREAVRAARAFVKTA